MGLGGDALCAVCIQRSTFVPRIHIRDNGVNQIQSFGMFLHKSKALGFSLAGIDRVQNEIEIWRVFFFLPRLVIYAGVVCFWLGMGF